MQGRPQQEADAGWGGPLIFFFPGLAGLAAELAQGLQAHEPISFDPAQVSSALRAGRQALVLWRDPASVLSACLTDGQSASRAMRGWADEARGLAVLFRQNRRQMILATADSLKADGVTALTERLGCPAIEPIRDPGAPAPLGLALARIALGQDAELARLFAELQSASLPGPDAAAADILDGVVAQMADARRESQISQQRLAELGRQTGEALAERDHVADALQAATGDLAQLRHVLAESKASADADLARTKAAADELRAQIGRIEAELKRARDEAEIAVSSASQRAASLSEQIAEQSQLIVETEVRLSEAEAEVELLRAQVGLVEETLPLEREAAQMQSDTAKLRIATLEAQVSLSEGVAETLDARLSERDAEADLWRKQAALTAELLPRERDAALARAEAATESLAVLEEQVSAQSKEAEHLASRLKARDAEAGLLLAQIGLLQENLANALMSGPAISLAEASAPPMASESAAAEQTGKAVSRALAQARNEAVLRAGLEKELGALKARHLDRAARDEELGHSQKMLAQMSKEGLASLDQIARLAEAHKLAVAERDALLRELEQLRSRTLSAAS